MFGRAMHLNTERFSVFGRALEHRWLLLDNQRMVLYLEVVASSGAAVQSKSGLSAVPVVGLDTVSARRLGG
jgi:hypothetical protein